MRALIIEDDPNDRDLARRELEDHGFTVIEAARGEQGIQIARDEAPQVILLDLGLRGEDGYTIARRIKADEQLRRIPIVALSGAHYGSITHQRAESVADAFLSKPLRTDELMRKLAQFGNGNGNGHHRQTSTPAADAADDTQELEVKTAVGSFRARGTDIIAVVIAIGITVNGAMLWQMAQDVARAQKSVVESNALVSNAIDKLSTAIDRQAIGQAKIEKAVNRQTCIMAYDQDRRARELHNVYSHCNQ